MTRGREERRGGGLVEVEVDGEGDMSDGRGVVCVCVVQGEPVRRSGGVLGTAEMARQVLLGPHLAQNGGLCAQASPTA